MERSFHDFNSLEKIFRTNLINSFTGFKSLNLIGTESISGISNLALFSQVIHVGANPPYVGVLFRPNSVPRHTLENIIETGFFTINHVKESFLVSAHQTSARWDISEFEALDIEKEYKEGFYAPFVKESNIKAACELNERIDIKSNGTHFIVGEIKRLYIPENTVSQDGYIDIEKAGSLTVSGLDNYHKTESIVRLPYAKPRHQEANL